MAQTLQQILGGINKLATVQSVLAGLPNVLPPAFLTPGQRVIGKTLAYDKISGQRQSARTNQYGAPARIVDQLGRTKAAVNMLHTFEAQNHDPLILQNLMRQDSEIIQALAVDEIMRQTREFLARFRNLRLGAVYSMLANGKIWLDGNGNLLFTSSGAVEAVDYSVPANNQNQINGIISASWATASTDIVGNVNAIKRAALQTTGYPLKHAFYGKNIAGYILGNTNASKLIQSNPALQNALYNTGEIPNGFCDLQWHPVHESFGLTGAGSVTEWFGGDAVVFTPEPTPDWYELAEGSYLTPSNLGLVAPTAESIANSLNQVFGMFNYATVSHNPATIQQFAGDTFLPLLKNGSAVFIADVTP